MTGAGERKCEWCGCVGFHSEVCEGFEINDPGASHPIRERSARGVPKPNTPIERRCSECGASFIGLAPGKTGERGIWTPDLRWVCSQECHDDRAETRRITAMRARLGNAY